MHLQPVQHGPAPSFEECSANRENRREKVHEQERKSVDALSLVTELIAFEREQYQRLAAYHPLIKHNLACVMEADSQDGPASERKASRKASSEARTLAPGIWVNLLVSKHDALIWGDRLYAALGVFSLSTRATGEKWRMLTLRLLTRRSDGDHGSSSAQGIPTTSIQMLKRCTFEEAFEACWETCFVLYIRLTSPWSATSLPVGARE
ncbi:hypothetical protein I7I51_05975 [Histoplasma capsulatum]|uniref:Uncharacterized protein n=1 Tax=Ajellomyces capsulatus TaxID=5037 RepID=A0A8A1MKG8_AJECA|nr:hypothetical protein I7I51_05975 [Histoplasma capsulatum]